MASGTAPQASRGVRAGAAFLPRRVGASWKPGGLKPQLRGSVQSRSTPRTHDSFPARLCHPPTPLSTGPLWPSIRVGVFAQLSSGG